MDVITKDVRALAKKELAAANRRFRMFASPHEGYAVIREELDELIDEVRKLHFGLRQSGCGEMSRETNP